LTKGDITLKVDLGNLEKRVEEVYTMAIHLDQLFKQYENFAIEVKKELVLEFEKLFSGYTHQFKQDIRAAGRELRNANTHIIELSEAIAIKSIQLAKIKAEIEEKKRQRKELQKDD
jgi:hypothetical protein